MEKAGAVLPDGSQREESDDVHQQIHLSKCQAFLLPRPLFTSINGTFYSSVDPLYAAGLPPVLQGTEPHTRTTRQANSIPSRGKDKK
jgi:hypothetical protein